MVEQFLRRIEVQRLTGLSRSAIYAGMSGGTFPRAIKIAKLAVAWRATDIEKWQAARIAESRAA